MRNLSLAVVYSVCLVLVMCLYIAPCAHADDEKVITIQDLKSDGACGPRCMRALIEVTGKGSRHGGIGCIYKLIGKRPFAATSLYDLKVAATKLGFLAEGRRLSVADLAKLRGYAILPIGQARGTVADPLHHILVVEGAREGFVRTINPDSLRTPLLSMDVLQKSWNGYALAIRSCLDNTALPIMADGDLKIGDRLLSRGYEKTKDFGKVEIGSVLKYVFADIGASSDEGCEHSIYAKNCSCVKASLNRDTEGKDNLAVEFAIEKHGWQTASVIVLDSATGTKTAYGMRAYGEDSFYVTPRIGFLRIPSNGRTVYPVRIEYVSGGSDTVKYEKMETDIPNLKDKLISSEQKTIKDGHSSVFDLSLIYDASGSKDGARTIKGKVRFSFSTLKGTRVIPMELTVETGSDGKPRAVPEKLFLMLPGTGEAIHRKVTVRHLADCAADDIVVESDSLVPLTISHSITPKNVLVLDIAVVGNARQFRRGTHRGSIVVRRNGRASAESTIEIPLAVYVRGR